MPKSYNQLISEYEGRKRFYSLFKSKHIPSIQETIDLLIATRDHLQAESERYGRLARRRKRHLHNTGRDHKTDKYYKRFREKESDYLFQLEGVI